MDVVVSHRHLQGQERGPGPAFPMGTTQRADEGGQLVWGSCGVRRTGGSENMPREGAKREPDSHEARREDGGVRANGEIWGDDSIATNRIIEWVQWLVASKGLRDPPCSRALHGARANLHQSSVGRATRRTALHGAAGGTESSPVCACVRFAISRAQRARVLL